MKPNSKPAQMSIATVVASLAVLCFVRQVSSWQMLEPVGIQQQQQHQTLQAPASTSTPGAGPAVNIVPASELRPSQHEQQQVGAPPSTAGKILDAATAVASTILKDAAAKQALKPRKQHESRDVYEAIRQQHERNPQYIRVNKKSSPVGETDGRDSSPVPSLLDILPGRGSIVKAIYDNKVARTITDVGKTIGSNKYVAGAAAASALAALGLAVSKLITPYMFAGGFSGGPETLMTSGSSSAESYLSPSRLSSTYGEYISGVSSSPPLEYSSQAVSPFAVGYSASPFAPPSYGQLDQSRASAYLDTSGSSPVSAYYRPGIFMQGPAPGLDGKPQEFFVTYKQQQQQSANGLPLTAASQQYSQRQPQNDVNGHYSQYYDSQQPAIVDGSSSNYNSGQYSPIYEQAGASGAYSARPGDYSAGSQQQNGDMMSSGDQTPSASVAMPSYAATTTNQLVGRTQPTRQPQSPPPSSRSGGGRRYGAVSLKLKDSDRARAVKASRDFEFSRPTFVKAEFNPLAGDKSAASSDLTSDRSSNRYPPQQQQQQPMMILTSINSSSSSNNYYKDQGQQLQQQANNNNVVGGGGYRMIKPMGRQTTPAMSTTTATTGDKPEAVERRRWISVPLQAQQNSIDHQESAAASNSAMVGGGESNGQQERVFRATTSGVTRGLDYELNSPQAASETPFHSGEISAGELASSDNNNVIKQIVAAAANTKSGAKLTAASQALRQQQQEPTGGLSIMSAPRELRPPHNGHQTASGAEPPQRASDGLDGLDGLDGSAEESNVALTATATLTNNGDQQGRGQSADSRGKSSNSNGEESSRAA